MRSLILLGVVAPLTAFGSDIAPCEGTVLERRLALAQAGKSARAYMAQNSELPAFCRDYIETDKAQASALISDSLHCGTNRENIVYYVCELRRSRSSSDKSEVTLVLESCTYTLDDRTISCENKSVVTTFVE